MILRKLTLATTAIVTLSTAVPGLAATQEMVNPYSTKLTQQSDKFVLDKLVADYRTDPSSFEFAMEYISLNRPKIKEAYLSQTAAIGVTSKSFAMGSGAIIGLGAAVGATAYFLSQKEDDSGPMDPLPAPPDEDEEGDTNNGGGNDGDDNGGNGGDDEPTPPSPPEEYIIGDANSFRTPEYNFNYALNQIGAAERYAQGPQGQGVKIAVLDTGIDASHPEFLDNIDVANSYSYIGAGNDYNDADGHGTHVAGIIAAAKNDLGTHGVAFGSELIIFRGIPSSAEEVDTITESNVWADAINRSVDAGAAVMNNSWVYTRPDGQGGNEAMPITAFSGRSELWNYLGAHTMGAFENARINDLLTVTATGNDGADEVAVNAGAVYLLNEFQGYHIAVTATDQHNQIAEFANRCGVAKDFCLAAPGVDIIAPYPGERLARMSGTSMAAPHVAGAAAVLKSQNPELTAPEISTILFDTATDLGAPGVDEIYGQGLLNLANAQSPQGNLVIYDGTSTRGGKTLLSDTGVVASSAMGAALSAALSDTSIMVADRYDRGFYMPAKSIVAATPAALPALNLASRSRVNQGLSFIKSSEGTGLEYESGPATYTIKRGNVVEASIREAVSPLSFVAADFGADYKFDFASNLSVDFGISGARGESDHAAASVGVTHSLHGASLSTRVGTLNEKGTVLGSNFLGAAGGDGNSRTAYLELRGDFDISSDTQLSLMGTRSETDFSQSGLISQGSGLTGTSGRLALSQKGFMGTSGVFTVSVSTPLQVTEGKLKVDMPQQRVASSEGKTSTGVMRTNSEVNFETKDRPYDIGFSYVTELADEQANFMLNAGYRSASVNSSPFASMSIQYKF